MNTLAGEKYWVSRQWKLIMLSLVLFTLVAAFTLDGTLIRSMAFLCGFYLLVLYRRQIKQALFVIEGNTLSIIHLPGRKKTIALTNIIIVEQSYFRLKGITIKNGLGHKVVLPTNMLSRQDHRRLLKTLKSRAHPS